MGKEEKGSWGHLSVVQEELRAMKVIIKTNLW